MTTGTECKHHADLLFEKNTSDYNLNTTVTVRARLDDLNHIVAVLPVGIAEARYGPDNIAKRTVKMCRWGLNCGQ